MKSAIKVIILIGAVFVLFWGLSILSSSRCWLTINVVDENGRAVQDAKVRVLFPQGLDVKRRCIEKLGKTNRNGAYSASSITIDPEIAFWVNKDGYYESGGRYRCKEMIKRIDSVKGTIKYFPKDVINVVLKKIESPVAMYSRDVDTRIPEIGRPIGFDLLVGDWVRPYGKGVNTDIILLYEGEYKEFSNQTNKLTLRCKDPRDGIIEIVFDYDNEYSKYRFPIKKAPESGYQNPWVFIVNKVQGKWYREGKKENQHFIFRVRTGEKDGPIYGKIVGGIVFGHEAPQKLVIRFRYYVNENKDERSLEAEVTNR